MKPDPRILALPFALALALGAAACGGGSSTGSSGGGGTAASTAPRASEATEPTEAASVEEASEAPAASVGGSGTGTTASGIVLPTGIGAVTYTTNEYTGDRLGMFLPMKSDELDLVLDAQGKTRADAVLALASPSDPAWPSIAAIKIIGGGGKGLGDQLVQGGYTLATWAAATVGGKSVQKATSDAGTTVVYATGDTLYLVSAMDPANLDAVVAALP
jgi:hypothetical protein